jgi:hypothetical protein
MSRRDRGRDLQLADLSVLADLAFMVVVGFAGDYVVGDLLQELVGHYVLEVEGYANLISRFHDIRSRLEGEAIGIVLFVASMIGVDSHLPVKVD